MSVSISGVGSITGIDQGFNITGGNVGIGTLFPENDIHIKAGSATMKLTSTDAATSARLILESEADSYGGVHFGDPSDEDAGRIRYYHGGSDPNHMQFTTDGSESLRINSDGKVLIGSDTLRNVGGASASSHLQIEGTTTNSSSISLINNQNATNCAVFRFGKTRGTSTGAVTTVADGDLLGAINFSGADGTDLQNDTARIGVVVNGTVSGNTIPSDLIFETSASSGNARAERLRINSSGHVGIGTNDPSITLHIDGDADTDILMLDTYAAGNYAQVRGANNSGIRIRGGGSYGGGMIDLGAGLRGTDPGVIKFHSGTSVTASNNEYMRLQANGEIAMKSSGSPTDALANLHVQNGTFLVSQADGVGTEYTKITTHPHATSDNRHMFTGVSNGIVRSQINKNGNTFVGGSYTAGRTRSDADSPTNYYFNGSFGFNAYSGRTDSSSNYRTIAFIRAWDGGDEGDRNVIYYADSGSDTTTNDYDQHQKFGIKANGMAQFGTSVFGGRVESDEGTPNSVYTGVSGTTMIVYPNSGSQYSRMDARTTDNTDQVFKVDSGGGVIIKFQSDGNGRFDGGADIGSASDYAEYFEWLDGNTSSDDRRGITVILDGEKIRPATDSDDTSKIIGVVSANPAVVGDSAWSEWQLAHQKDVYGGWVTKDEEFLVWNKFGTFTDTDGVKKPNPQPDINDYNMASDFQILVSDIEKEKAAGRCPQAAIDQNLRVTKPSRTYNPDYDKTRTYVPRSQRKEWDAIGLMGKLVVRRGQPIGANWILMKSNVGVDPNDSSIILDKYLVR